MKHVKYYKNIGSIMGWKEKADIISLVFTIINAQL